jgi:hypothetical protein
MTKGQQLYYVYQRFCDANNVAVPRTQEWGNMAPKRRKVWEDFAAHLLQSAEQ